VPKTASSTASSTTNLTSPSSTGTTTATTTKGNPLGDKHYVWVEGKSKLYNMGVEVGFGLSPSLPPIGATLDMLILKKNQSCNPQGSGYLIEKAYVRQ